ncbi:MAG: hypothetical protein CL693_13115 [Cellvibrionaceae bacterium]|nr:hypothetical protein [Cellvibrionaceae bacterium]|tara:strand:- start:10104 stop:10685 length:582 start_codon:yes stop_codon:yes gene_type:complete
MFSIDTKKLLGAAALSLTPVMALAHSGHEATSMLSGLVSGALHPLLGLDHLLALLLVGALASQLQGQQRWGVVVAFVGLMGVGFFSAHAGIHAVSSGTVETLITTSLVVGALLLLVGQLAKRSLQNNTLLSRVSAWGMTAFAAFHGVAHGLEIPAGSALSGFGVGFLAASFGVMSLMIVAVPLFKRQSSQAHQ